MITPLCPLQLKPVIYSTFFLGIRSLFCFDISFGSILPCHYDVHEDMPEENNLSLVTNTILRVNKNMEEKKKKEKI